MITSKDLFDDPIITVTFDYEDDDTADIRRCLSMLYSTLVGSCPLYRDFGLDPTVIDLPLDAAKNRIAVDITEKTEEYEPRVEVESVDFEFDSLIGQMRITVEVSHVDTEDQ